MVSLAAAEGLAYDFDRYQVINTLDAHRVAYLGKAHGLEDAIQERFLRGQLDEGEVLDDLETLVRLGSEVGIPADEVRDVLAGDAYAAGRPGRHRRGARDRRHGRPVLRHRPPVRDLRAPSPPSCSCSALEQASAEAAAAG